MSFEAAFIVQDETFNVRSFNWSIHQSADTLNRADTLVQGGQLHIELDSQPSDLLHFWALDNTKRLDGKILVFEADSRAVRKTIEFQDAYCVGLSKHFDGTGSASGMVMTLRLSAGKLQCGEVVLDNKWAS
jgi:hypothetical protein